MSEQLVVISFNQPLDPENRTRIVSNSGLTKKDVLSTQLTAILPEFADVYRYGVSDTLRGVMQRATRGEAAYDALPYNFGLVEIPGLEVDGKETIGLLPCIKERKRKLFDDPPVAVVNYHGNLIRDINASLAAQRSPLRLASLALSAL